VSGKSAPRYTVVDELPPARRSGARAKRGSRYDPILDAALEAEGSWLRVDQYGADERRLAHGAASGINSAAKRATKRLGLAAGFAVSVRQAEDGRFYPYVRKLRRAVKP
jgi:hypothetical protein